MALSRSRSTAGPALTVLFVFWPFVLALLAIAVLSVFLLGAMVVAAFRAGFTEGCAALAALIGIPSVGLLWLSAAVRLLGRKSLPMARADFGPTDAELYPAGDFVHRDYEAEKREGEAFRREKGW